MVTREKEICGNPPSLQVIYHYTCDECGGEVASEGFKEQKLWELKETGEQFCFECMWERLIADGIIEEV